ncbi:MAG: hypothetical protein ABFS10_05590 [Bacteroidota bacterium]
MKKTFVTGMLILLGTLFAGAVAPYLKIAELNMGMDGATEKVVSVLTSQGYEILGDYAPGRNYGLHVVVFTNDKIKELSRKSGDRGMLAAAMKVGLQRENGKTVVSVVNPEYLFFAYFRDKMEVASFKSEALSVSASVRKDLEGIGNMMKPFGGEVSRKDLMKYRYMVGMPEFDDPVTLAEFGSFEEGLATIRKNLSAGKGATIKVYEMVDRNGRRAIFGVGLSDKEEGESHFLPIIGESHVAAMPYEIILQGKKATMLHGRYRFALHWPELTMGTFTKIMSSPGDVEDAMNSLME